MLQYLLHMKYIQHKMAISGINGVYPILEKRQKKAMTLQIYLFKNLNLSTLNFHDRIDIREYIDVDRWAVSSFSPLSVIQHNKYSKIVKWTLPRQEKYPALPGFPSQPAQNRPGPVCPANLVHIAPTLHFFIRYSYIIHLFQNGVTTVLDVDCHSMLYIF